MAKRVRTDEANWSNLPTNLLQSIVKELNFEDMARFKAVCLSWNMSVRSHTSSLIPSMLTCTTSNEQQEHKKHHKANISFSRFFSLTQNKVYEVKKVFGRFSDFCCVGSSCGWMVILDAKKDPKLHLVDPFSGFEIGGFPSVRSLFPERIRRREDMIAKAILSSDPYVNNKFVVVVMHSFSLGIAFCKQGDKQWTELSDSLQDDQDQHYCDIIYHDEKLYALTLESGLVEVWKLQGHDHGSSPTKLFTIERLTVFEEWRTYGLHLYRLNTMCYKVRFHLVESSSGKILLVLRLVGKFDNMSSTGFITRRFAVCKLDSSGQCWVSIMSVSDRAKLIAEYQHCAEYERYSTYNTDDYLTQSLVRLD
ncbi:putative F-box protein At4g22660 [Ziziphus jujuba]|uniref:F-box protein At4g22660 n=1 Tax=Ziziphus jujuba TaxID=326968 RepID=A0A6P4BIY6_ZIZJJ|nr:putative F-box protein At4g22660 [Ziziphus jujuba]